jgi:polyhydroxybutyrate depolymerase
VRGAAVVLVALVVGCAGALVVLHDAAGAPARAPARAPGPCSTAPAAGERDLDVLAGTPPLVVHVPPGVPAGRRVPLVLGLHGATEDGHAFERDSGLSKAADRHGFVVAYPQSPRARHFWAYPEPDNPASGLRLLTASLDTLESSLCIDTGRVLVTGHSSGGRMTYAAGCELAARILAIAPVSGGTKRLPACHPSRPISVLDMHGTSDRIVAYRGAGPAHDGRVSDVMARWARLDGCRPQPTARRFQRFVVEQDWHGCRDGVRVEHLRIQGAEHPWPPHGGPRGIGLDASEAIWDFFAALPGRRR